MVSRERGTYMLDQSLTKNTFYIEDDTELASLPTNTTATSNFGKTAISSMAINMKTGKSSWLCSDGWTALA